ncbi:MAG TPA: TetR/AcrR family transcriptional regulator [Phenylobacterium sp.]|nr:TetR/AcrR family transcriptional regulator [Phenylobacterium sp.]HQP20486.1 TetR/AcrR family transcriptional regulator [Phenylobacterium sp.]
MERLSVDTPPVGRREQIYLVAARLFAEFGYGGTSMGDIAKKVGINKASLYHFVPNKEDLLYTLISWGLDLAAKDVVAPAQAIADPRARLETLIRLQLANIHRGAGPKGNAVHMVVSETSGLSPDRRAEVEARKAVFTDLIRSTLDALKAEGRFGLADTALATANIQGLLSAFARWDRPGDPDLDRTYDELTAFILRAVLKD